MYLQAGSTNNAIDVFNAAGTTQLFKLTGTGAATFSSSVTAATLIFKDAINSNSYGFRGLSGIVTLDAGSVYPTGWNFQFGGGASSALYINGSGNVGIGTTTPARALEVYSSNTSQTAQLIVSSGTNTKAYLGTFSNSLYLTAGGTFNGGWSTDGSNAVGAIVIGASNNDSSIAFQTNNTNAAPQNRMFINNAGNVGIGTTAPTSKLHVVGLPTSSSGLTAGAIWIDGTTLKIVT
jgi:hypothetical protein